LKTKFSYNLNVSYLYEKHENHIKFYVETYYFFSIKKSHLIKFWEKPFFDRFNTKLENSKKFSEAKNVWKTRNVEKSPRGLRDKYIILNPTWGICPNLIRSYKKGGGETNFVSFTM